MMKKSRVTLALLVLLTGTTWLTAAEGETIWKRHTIDRSSRGADGVRLADVNGDGLLDTVTGWEEGGRIRVCINPGPERAKKPWPSVTVGKVRSPEDAVFVDLDADGAIDVVSCCEGREKTVFMHWAPKQKSRYLDAEAWKTEPVPASRNVTSWMYCLPMQIDGQNGVDLVVGAKGNNAAIGWFEAPKNPRDLAAWKWHPIYEAGWIMSLLAMDVDGDGDRDVVTTDRKGKNRGCRWLENPGPGAQQQQPWKEHLVGGAGLEVMFMVATDLNRDGKQDFLTAVRRDDLLYFQRTDSVGGKPAWKTHRIALTAETGTGKGVHVADFNLDGRLDIVFTCEGAQGRSGVVLLTQKGIRPVIDAEWAAQDISGTKEGIKFDQVQLLDLDADGDLDLLTCEERDNLGLIWYENPTK